MRERGMIFNAEMVRALLDGRKTQTRRIMKVQPDSPEFGLLRITDSTKRSDIGKYHWAESNACGINVRSKLFACPFGAVGDRLWVREAFRVHSKATDVATLAYRASERQSWTQQTRRIPISECNKPVSPEAWTPSLHMLRWASRITLKITSVRVERLNSMTEEDARAEGCMGGHDSIPGYMYSATPHEHFHHLWASIYGEDSWLANPWVWVVEFKRVEDEQ